MTRTLLTLAATSLVAATGHAQEVRAILKGATDQSTYIRIVDATDGTPETGVTSATGGLDLEYVRSRAAAADLTESDLGAANSAHSDGGIIHVGNGVYRVDLPDAAVASGADSVLVGGTATGMVVIPARIQLTGFDLQDAQPTAEAIAAGGITATSIATDAIGADELAAGGVSEIQSGLATSAALATVDTVVDEILDDTGTSGVVLAAGQEMSIDAAGLDAISTDVWTHGTRELTSLGTGSGLTAIPWNAAWDAEVQSEAADALAAYDPPTKAELDAAVDALPTAAENADAVWDEAQAGHTTNGTFGEYLDAAVSGVSTGGVSAEDIAEAVRTELTTELGRIDVATSTRLATAGYTAPLDAAGVRAAVGLASANLDTQLGSIDLGDGSGLTAIPWNAAWDAEVQSEAADAMNAYDGPTKAEMDAGFAAVSVTLSPEDIEEIVAGIGEGIAPPRINFAPDPEFTRVVPSGASGQSRVSVPINIPAGDVGDQVVALDMSLLYGRSNNVAAVGVPTITAGTVSAVAVGPRDWFAYVRLDGTIAAGEQHTVSVPVTMVSGATRTVRFVVRGIE